jgi:hypothetical protein
MQMNSPNDLRVPDLRARILEAVGRFIIDYRDVNSK